MCRQGIIRKKDKNIKISTYIFGEATKRNEDNKLEPTLAGDYSLKSLSLSY